MSLRLKRLASEHKQLTAGYKSHPQICVRPETADPPERYEVDFRVKGLELLPNGELVSRTEHTIEIVLPADYPRRPPMCKMKTSVFHPNIDVWTICTSDHWAAQETLVDLVVRIGQMIAYQSYNTKSPLNADAARWCDENEPRLPVDSTDLHPLRTVTPSELLHRICDDARLHFDAMSRAHTIVEARKRLDAAVAALSKEVDIDQRDDACVSLANERDKLVQKAEMLSASLVTLQLLDQHNDARRRWGEEAGRYRRAAADADGLTNQVLDLPSPPWVNEGTLETAYLEGIRSSVSRVKDEFERAINRMKDRPPSMSEELDGIDTIGLTAELRSLADQIRNGRRADTPALSPSLMEASGRCQALSSAAEFLEFLTHAYKQYRDYTEQKRSLLALVNDLADDRDKVVLSRNGHSMELSVGDECPFGTFGTLRCRLRSHGLLELTDADGRRLVELNGDGPKVIHGVSPPLTVHAKGVSSTRVFREAEVAIRDSHSKYAPPTRTPQGANLPTWWRSWTVPVSPSSIEAIVEVATGLREQAKRRFETGRIRTMSLDLRFLLRQNADITSQLYSHQGELDSLCQQLDAITAKGKKTRDGRLLLTQERLMQYESVYQRVAVLRKYVAELSQRLDRHCSVIDEAGRDLQAFLRRVPESVMTTSLRSELQEVALHVRTVLEDWRGRGERQ